MQVTDEHPVTAVVAALHADLDAGASLSVLGLGGSDTATVVTEIARIEARLAELRSRVLAHVPTTDVVADAGATSAPIWLANLTVATRRDARRQTHLADALTTRTHLHEAMSHGRLRVEQAHAITRALEALPDDLDPALVEKAERHLVDEARLHDADRLTVLGRHLLEVVAPEIGEAHAAKQLEDEERRATQKARLSLTDDGHGSTHGRFSIPTLHAAMFRKALQALIAPERAEVRRPAPARMGQAFCDLLERLADHHLPSHGGGGATVVVMMSLETLLGRGHGGLAEAVLDTGDHISAATARRLACEHGLVPAVLGGRSQILDLGRRRRIYTRAQRVAMAVRDRHCTAEGCTTAPGFCHAHHDRPWSRGGRTDLADGRLLCPTHHRMIHDPQYEIRVSEDNRVAFYRRT